MLDDEVGYRTPSSDTSQTSQNPSYAPPRFESVVRSILKHAGGEAVKVFLRALEAVIEDIEKSDWERFDILHRIDHGKGRRYGTPLDEIRICNRDVRPSLAKALRRIRS